MTGLEAITFSDVKDRQGRTYADFRKALCPRWAIVWRDLAVGLLSLAFFVAASASLVHAAPIGRILSIPVLGLFSGLALSYVNLFVHEAAHYNLHPSRRINDLLCNATIGMLLTASVEDYRKIHWLHHLNLGTPGDPENTYFRHLDWAFVGESLTGVHLLRVFIRRFAWLSSDKGRSDLVNGVGAGSHSPRGRRLGILIPAVLLNVAFVAAMIAIGLWHTGLMWALQHTIFFPFFASIRVMAEHRSLNAHAGIDYGVTDHGQTNRLFFGPLARVLGGAGFDRHLLHHWDPYISYTRLGDVEDFLRRDDRCAFRLDAARTSYSAILRALFNRANPTPPRNPHVASNE